MPTAAQPSLFKGPLHKIYEVQDAIKEDKKMLKEIVEDEPMELEDLRLALKDMKQQVKAKETEHLKHLTETNTDYMEIRERIQSSKEELAKAKLELVGQISMEKAKTGEEIDMTVQVDGMPFRLQTQGETSIFINGKLLK